MNTNLIEKINQYITDNGNGLITGPVLNQVLRDMVNQSVANVTYASLSNIITNKQVIPGMVYKIIDRGNVGIFLTGLTDAIISREGVHIMLCPKTYKTEILDGNSWRGVWHNDKSADMDDLFIHGGLVWKNLTGNIGTTVSYIELDNVNWVLVPKTSFINKEYIAKPIECLFDFSNDWIEQQWIRGLRAGVDKALYERVGPVLGANPIDLTDWNIETSGVTIEENITAFGFFNNDTEPTLDWPYPTIAKVSASFIAGNSTRAIVNIICHANGGSSIADMTGAIVNNECGSIMDVYQSGGIEGVPKNIGEYGYHTDDESFYLEWDFDNSPVTSGNSVLRNCILKSGRVLTEMTVIGDGLAGTGTPQIKVGLQTDDESYIGFTNISTINSGVKNTAIGSKTTTAYRQFKISVTGGDVTAGILRISGKYL